MKTKIKAGVHRETRFLDELGSTSTVERKYHSGGKLVTPVHNYLEMNTRITSDEELYEWFARYVKDVLRDNNKLDSGIKFRVTKAGQEQGYYLAIACYTELGFE